MNIFKNIQNSSTLICAEKGGVNVFGNGFFAGKSKKNTRIFLFANLNLVKGATSLKFLRYLGEKEGHKWIELEDFEKKCRESRYGIVKINLSHVLEDVDDDCLWAEDIISNEEIYRFNLLETLYVVSAPPIKYPAYLDTINMPILEDCKNVVHLDSDEFGFFVVNLNNADWRAGAPVYACFGEKFKLVGMVGDWKMPEGLTPVIPANVIRAGIEE